VINVEEWAEIRRLHRAEGMGIKAIARRLGVARNTVRSALRADDRPKYERKGRGSAVEQLRASYQAVVGGDRRTCPPPSWQSDRLDAWHHRAA